MILRLISCFWGIFLLTWCNYSLHGQELQSEIEYTIYFEDAVGNQDSVLLGHDRRVQPYFIYDPRFHDSTWIGPMDPIFEVRVNVRNNPGNAITLTEKNFKHIVTGLEGSRCTFPSVFTVQIHALHPPVRMWMDRTISGLTLDNCELYPLVLYDELFHNGPDFGMVDSSWWDCFEVIGDDFSLELDTLNWAGDNSSYSFAYVQGKGKIKVPTFRVYFGGEPTGDWWEPCEDKVILTSENRDNEEDKKAWFRDRSLYTNFEYDEVLYYDISGRRLGDDFILKGVVIASFKNKNRKVHVQKFLFHN